MNVSTQDILNNNEAEFEDHDEEETQQMDYIDSLYDSNIIPYKIPCGNKHNKTKFIPLDYAKLYETQKGEFYNFKLLEEVMCRLSGHLLTWNKHHNLYRYTKTLGLLKQFASGTNALVFNNLLENLVIKVSKEYDEAEFKYESIVGFIMNELRETIPNFMFTYASFVTKIPQELEDNNYMITVNPIRESTGYIILENIEPSISVKSLLGCSFKKNNQELGSEIFKNKFGVRDYLLLLSQITLSLRTAYEKFKFTHYDLNYNNVMIRLGKKGSYIKYPSESGQDYYVQSDVVATIIDYGYAYLEYDGYDIGKFGFENYGIVHNHPFPMHDVYKFYMFTMNLLVNKKKIFEKLKPIFEFFNQTDNIEEALEEQFETFYALPYSKKNGKVTHDQFMNFLIREYKEYDFISTKPKPTLGCEDYTCHDITDFEIRKVQDLNVLHNWMKMGKDITSYKHRYQKLKPTWIDQIEDLEEELEEAVGHKSVYIMSDIIANKTILNELEEYFGGKALYDVEELERKKGKLIRTLK